jgi:tRNA (cytidine/uridine-2'-O-)-methyltransferase
LPFHVALFEPEIPANAGSAARLCAATGSPLHLIGRLGFSFRHPEARRAGMDYWDSVEVHRHLNVDDFRAATAGRRVWMLSTRGGGTIWETAFRPGDVLLFGRESSGLPAALLEADPARALHIPMAAGVRSLNLSTSVAIVLYEALRQVGWRGSRPG